MGVNGNLTAIIIMAILALIPITIVTVVQLSKLKLRVEQIKADAIVRAEEVKARNQLEIEKLIYQNQRTNESKKLFDNEGSFYNNTDETVTVREKGNINA